MNQTSTLQRFDTGDTETQRKSRRCIFPWFRSIFGCQLNVSIPSAVSIYLTFLAIDQHPLCQSLVTINIYSIQGELPHAQPPSMRDCILPIEGIPSPKALVYISGDVSLMLDNII